MNILRKLLKLSFLIIILGIIALGVWVYINQTSPLDIELDQPTHTIKNYIKPDKTLVISFWASWCGYCMREVSVLKELKSKHSDLDILGIQVDDGKPGEVFRNSGYPSLNANKNGNNIMFRFGNYSAAVPFIVILKDNGKQINTFSGETGLNQLEQIIYSPSKDNH